MWGRKSGGSFGRFSSFFSDIADRRMGSLFYLNGLDIAVLNPKGAIAGRERQLLIATTLLMLIVAVPTLVLTLFFAWRYREKNTKAKYTPDVDRHPSAELIWWGVPFVIVVVIAVICWRGCLELDPFKPLTSNTQPLKIQVVALQWKWLFIYPEQNIATVNFFQFPEETPVDFEITADAPMNSFWIPQLGGQIYAMPGMRSKLHLIASEAGEYRGVSANLSGRGFSGMTFLAKSSSKSDFDSWVARVKESPDSLSLERYRALAQPSENDKIVFYSSADADLYSQIMMKYMSGMVDGI